MIWCADCGNIADALRIGEYALRHKLPMPDQYQRTTATVLVEEICDPLLAAFKADPTKAPISADLLEALRGLTQNEDMPDEVRAKLLKALGYTLRLEEQQESRVTAVGYLRHAAVLSPKKAGVTRDIEILQRQLDKEIQSDNSTDLPSDSDTADKKVEAHNRQTPPKKTARTHKKAEQ
jgi:hypothetical protein